MKRLAKLISAFLLTLILLTGVVGCSSNEFKTYELPHFDYSEGTGEEVNRELFYKNIGDISGTGDPTTVYVEQEDGGWFYTAGTGAGAGAGFTIWRSRNLTDWEMVKTIWTNTLDFYGVESFWAPQLFWDKDADWQYYLGDGAGEGKGLWCLFFSARVGFDRVNQLGQQTCQLTVAFSKTIDGDYKLFNGINANGTMVDAGSYLFDIENINPETNPLNIDLSKIAEWEEAHEAFGPVYIKGRSFIDACPFIDPVSGDKYLYFCCNRYAGDKSNDIWGVKMKDWVSCDYETVRPLSAEGYVNPDKKELFDWQTPNGTGRIDEGPFMHYEDFTDDGVDNGTYYLTMSLLAGGYHHYAPVQALSSSPLGDFHKVLAKDGGFVIQTDVDWDISAVGHHDFFYMGEEIWISYHSYKMINGQQTGGRLWKCDRVKFVEGKDGQMLMRANGPSLTVQPLPEMVSGYRNVAEDATVTVSGGNDKTLLNDGYLAINKDRLVDEFISDKAETVITLKWQDYVTARAIMIYNSYDYKRIFDNIEKVEFSVRKKIDGKYYYGKAIIKDLGFNFERDRVSLLFLIGDVDFDEIDLSDEYKVPRPCVSATAEFDEIEINAAKITVKKGADKTAVGISEIVVLGRTA